MKKLRFKTKTSEMFVRPNKVWFRNKRYGWGWTPDTWEGWLVLVGYVVGIIYLTQTIDPSTHSGGDILIGLCVPALALTCLMIVICYLTGEKPGWHWGGK